jgi:hypothetical protein
MSTPELAAAGIGARRTGPWWRLICPVHGSRTSRTLTRALRDGDLGMVAHCRDDTLATLRRIRPRSGDSADHAQRSARTRHAREADGDARGGPVGRCLAGRTLPLLSSLRWPSSPRGGQGADVPPMVARVDGLHGELVAVHRIWLDHGHHGQWKRRASVGRAAGGAVRLPPAAGWGGHGSAPKRSTSEAG